MHTAAVSHDGEVLCWGRADSGQLGIGRRWREADVDGVAGHDRDDLAQAGLCYPEKIDAPTVDAPFVQVSCGAFHTAAVTASGRVFSWGKEEFGCLGVHLTGLSSGVYSPREVGLAHEAKAVQVACGGNHTLLLVHGGKAFACGKNEYGRLGVGSQPNQLTMCEVKMPNDEPVASLAAGGSHSAFLTASGKIFVCGRGDHGRLGTGTDTSLLEPAVVEAVAASNRQVMHLSCGGQHTSCCFKAGS